ncbi:MAG: polysaccharide deacetylase family protein [Bacillota bacterium]|jgi:peptidoglycan/xylan/chitin deacetylase (PgdA/CDA1 family)|nr:polysaccharide deacetylase family protein [Bacillota bacterium]HHU43564.1 polysaccharide deacetylase family protein [Clostridiales bacterium]
MFIVIKKSKIIVAILIIATIIIACSLYLTTDITTAFSAKKKLPIYSVECEENLVALSFDAAWGADKTTKIMDILDEYNMKATFFVVGFWIDKFPEKAKEIHERGFLLANHSTNHLHMNTLSPEEIKKEIETTNKKIYDITNEKTLYFRAPFGEYNNNLLDYIEQSNMYCIQWDVDSLDWKGLKGGQIADRVLAKVKKGSIVLFHNNSDYILEALPLVLMGLKNKKMTCVRMDELIIKDDYYIDNNGRQKKR